MLQMIYHTVSSPILTSSLSMEELEKVNGGFAPLIALKGFKGSGNNEKKRRRKFSVAIIYMYFECVGVVTSDVRRRSLHLGDHRLGARHGHRDHRDHQGLHHRRCSWHRRRGSDDG